MKTYRVTYLVDVEDDVDPIDYEGLMGLGAYDVEDEEVEPVAAPPRGERKPKAAS